MVKEARPPNALPTNWRVPDELWEAIAPILSEYDPQKPRGRKRINQRAALDALIFRMQRRQMEPVAQSVLVEGAVSAISRESLRPTVQVAS